MDTVQEKLNEELDSKTCNDIKESDTGSSNTLGVLTTCDRSDWRIMESSLITDP